MHSSMLLSEACLAETATIAQASSSYGGATQHVCAVQVSRAKTGYKPSLGQYRLYDKFFVYLTAPPGFCKTQPTDPSQRQCHVFAAQTDEFG